MIAEIKNWTLSYCVAFAALVVVTTFTLSVDAWEPSEPVDFDRQIKPLLSDRCFLCHGPDASNREGDLRLDREADAKESAIVPNKPEQSEVIRRITSSDPDEQMPPPDSKLSLSGEERELIKAWIAQGATWKQHWSFVSPQSVDVPKSKGAPWSRNAIDEFILRDLREAKLKPAPTADATTLIRRLTFDLTGMPPTLEEIEAFVEACESDPDAAWEEAIGRLLNSPRYGERMAATWLDAARYSDTYGYQVDRDRFVWPWRDWVVRSFNDNLPYDDFITQQLAGDLLPNATDDQILATTFNRLHPQKVEGGSTPEEFRIEYVADRTQTVATAFLGLTMECCRCHDHKYDPLSQREYYQLSAFFDNIDEAGLYSYFTPSVPTPTLTIADDAAKQKLTELEAKIHSAQEALDAVVASAKPRFQKWLQSEASISKGAKGAKGVKSQEDAEPNSKKSTSPSISLDPLQGQVAYLDFEDGKVSGANQSVPGKIGKAVKLSGDDAVSLKVGNFPRFQPFTISLWMNTPDTKDRAIVFHRSRAWTDAGSRGYQLLIEDGKLSASLIHFWPGNAIRVRTKSPLPVGKWAHVAVTYDGSSKAAGLRIHVNGEAAPCDIVRDNLYKHVTGGGGDNIAIGERFRDRGFTNGLVDEFRVFDRQLTSLETRHLYDSTSLNDALTAGRTALAKSDPALLDYYLTNFDAPWAEKRSALMAASQKYCKAQDALQEIMVMREMAAPRQTYVLKRGAYDARGDEVQAKTPEAFAPPWANVPANRLGLARWLCSPDHPLTSRVAVNRIWQIVMGHGLVRTPEDFGKQGQPPTHPELLDWLASDFVSHSWDVKRLVKQIVSSSAYRQSSAATPETLAADPENRLWGRSAAFRMPAEMLRDNALAISGLLVEKQGGPPVRPYELEASFKPSKRDKGDGLYRRSLYTYWKRTGPAPMMMVLDSAKRDVCRVKRERTATPLESFVMMNSPQFVEASRILAEQLVRASMEEGQPLKGAREQTLVVGIFRRTTSRFPTRQEQKVLEDLLQYQRSRFAEKPDQAKAYRNVGDAPIDGSLDDIEVAAVAAVVNAMLNYDEAVMRR